MKVASMVRVVLIGVAALVLPAQARAQAANTFPDDSAPAVGVQYAFMGLKEIEGTSLFGVDVNYATKMLSQPFSELGIRAGAIGEFGVHKYDDGGGTQTLIQGGIQLRSDRIRGRKIVPSARIMVGINKFPEGTDFGLTLMPGLDFMLENKKYHARVEYGQVWDFFDGGSLATWRLGVGIVVPLK